MEKRNILVTGADGFLGSHFVDRAVADGHTVTALDFFPGGGSRNLEGHGEAIRKVAGDVQDESVLREALKDIEVVYHFAWDSNPSTTWDRPTVEIETNLRITTQVYLSAAEAGVRKLVFPSSGGTVYGAHETACAEDVLPRPFNPYGIAKMSVEHFMDYICRSHGLSGDVYRIGNPYGPRQPVSSGQGVIAVWMDRILRGEPIDVYGDDRTVRDYVYIKDLCELLTHSLRDLSASGTWNVGTGQGVAITELAERVSRATGREVERRLHPRREFDNLSCVLDAGRLLSHFPGFAFKDMDAMLAETWDCLVASKAAG